MLNVSRQWLMTLLDTGSQVASGVPGAAKAEIGHLADVGFIRWEKAGAGARYIIVDEEAIRQLLGNTGYQQDLETLTPKARAVALHGDAHKGKDDAMLLLLSAAGHADWDNGENRLDVSDHVSRFGMASLIVRPGDQWQTSQPVGLVENLDPVLYASPYCHKVSFQGSLLYYSGWLSKPFLAWLTEIRRAPSFILFADYDPVGISNYLRAKEKIGSALQMYIPGNIEELLLKFGKKMELKSGHPLIESTDDPTAINLYRTLLDTGRILHQESLLLM